MTMHSNCETCPAHAEMARLGEAVGGFDRIVALAGNPNTGKSTLFNALTGLRQHTGNWPGKTVSRAEGGFQFNGVKYKLVDLPGTYSLLSASQDEEVARNFLLFGKPDCTVVVVDASALERNLYLVLQVLEITDRVVVAVNLMDEARRRGIEVDTRSLARDLGVPVVPIVARTSENIMTLLSETAGVASGETATSPAALEGDTRVRTRGQPAGAADRVVRSGAAQRAMDCDSAAGRRRRGRRGAGERQARRTGGTPAGARSALQPEDRAAGGAMSEPAAISPADIVKEAAALRRSLETGFREEVVTSLYTRGRAHHAPGRPRHGRPDAGTGSADRSHRHVASLRPAVDAR